MHPRRIALLVAAAALGLPACSSGGTGPYKAPPGQVQKMTGYNPASGKMQGAPRTAKAPAAGKSKAK